MRTGLVYAVSALVRVSLALATRTFFQPDEYFQSLEIAHHLVFGFGHLTWEWTTKQPIRSIFFPSVFVPIYWALKVLKLDESGLLIIAPKIIQALLAAITDVATYRLSKRLLGETYAKISLILSLTSFFNALALQRSLSNSLETAFTVLALSYWPFETGGYQRSRTRWSLAFAAVACMVRPTNGVIWIFLVAELAWRLSFDTVSIVALAQDGIVIGFLALGCLLFVDTLYFGSLTLTPLNFLRTNMSSVSLFYGHNPFHFYLTQALPLLLTTALPFFLHGTYLVLQRDSSPSLKRLLGLVGWTLAIYSLAGHKEWRFIHPLLPAMLIVSSLSVVDAYRSRSGRTRDHSIPALRRHLLFLGVSLPAVIYITRFHGRAQIAVMHYLRSLPRERLHSVGFLMPCHSTPWQAYLHRPELEGHMWAIGCEPPLEGQVLEEYRDQTDVFFASPVDYLKTRFPGTVDITFPPSPYPTTPPGELVPSMQGWVHTWPSHIVLFGALLEEPSVKELLIARGYAEAWHSTNGWEEDHRRRGGVRVWEWTVAGYGR